MRGRGYRLRAEGGKACYARREVARPGSEAVFSSPDPAEAGRACARLQAKGLRPEILSGPDPVTGLGGHLLGGAGSYVYVVEVPSPHAEAAREILREGETAGDAPPAGEAPAPADTSMGRLRRLRRPIVGGYLLACIVTPVVAAFFEDATGVLVIAGFMVAGLLLLVLVLGGRGGRGPP
jgi:hypothetical protein